MLLNYTGERIIQGNVSFRSIRLIENLRVIQVMVALPYG